MFRVVDEDCHRRLSMAEEPGWQFCEIGGPAGMRALLRPVFDPGSFRTNIIACRDDVAATVTLRDLADAGNRHLAATYGDLDLRGSESVVLGDASAVVVMRAFDVGPHALRVNQLQAIIDGGADPAGGEGSSRVIYQLIATLAAECAETHADDVVELVGGATVAFAPGFAGVGGPGAANPR